MAAAAVGVAWGVAWAAGAGEGNPSRGHETAGLCGALSGRATETRRDFCLLGVTQSSSGWRWRPEFPALSVSVFVPLVFPGLAPPVSGTLGPSRPLQPRGLGDRPPSDGPSSGPTGSAVPSVCRPEGRSFSGYVRRKLFRCRNMFYTIADQYFRNIQCKRMTQKTYRDRYELSSCNYPL